MPIEENRILIAEDDPYLRKALGSFIEDENVLVDIAEDGKEAIRFLHENQYRLVLLDINMPFKNGFDVLREVNTLTTPPPALIFSNFDREDSRQQALALGARDYFVKHKVDIDELRTIVRTYLKGKVV